MPFHTDRIQHEAPRQGSPLFDPLAPGPAQESSPPHPLSMLGAPSTGPADPQAAAEPFHGMYDGPSAHPGQGKGFHSDNPAWTSRTPRTQRYLDMRFRRQFGAAADARTPTLPPDPAPPAGAATAVLDPYAPLRTNSTGIGVPPRPEPIVPQGPMATRGHGTAPPLPPTGSLPGRPSVAPPSQPPPPVLSQEEADRL